jgi:excisionase family DNA binding protein
MFSRAPSSTDRTEHHTTFEVARMLGLAVRSVQLMVDRGELDAWKTEGGHRRITDASVMRWLDEHPQHKKGPLTSKRSGGNVAVLNASIGPKTSRVLLIEDSIHYQNLIRLLMQELFPDVELHVANEGFSGLAMFGALNPDVLLLDMMLPGMDGATLIGALRSNPTFQRVHLIVVTSLSPAELQKHKFVLQGVLVVHKTDLMSQLPLQLAEAFKHAPEAAGVD